ncbi:MAG: hypothetical protein K9I74_08025 [Bacteroidales bacterium]|nr:hypothetical protein [Bacteroidales bacterium]
MWWWWFWWSEFKNSDYLKKKVRVYIEFNDEKNIYSEDLISLLNSLEIINDLGVVSIFDKYKNIKNNKYFYYRSNRKIDSDQKLAIANINKSSPISVELIVGCVGALWILVQVIERINNWSLNRQKLKLEIENLKNKNNEVKQQEENSENEYLRYLDESDEMKKRIYKISNDLENVKLTLKNFDIKCKAHNSNS